ncbi:DUF6378 domain-containing protein [Anaeromassilibacillus senegalensis]|uniref:DUF6378 domain-containing protein n=1 Tax=Anaeromassilibacillus senegalensis TaxID=1673717 RepID=UPI00067FDD0F|nr:DUF6378 domain-containing protein [Anaeromassilibacillus senegalensis]
MNRLEILDAAQKRVCERQNDHGKPEDNFSLIANYWEIYIKYHCVSPDGCVCIRPKDVAMLMALLKIARVCTGKKPEDSYIDLAGYAACGGEIGTGG